MAHNTAETALGAVVIAAAAGFLWFALQGEGRGLVGGAAAYEVTAQFRSVEGVGVGTDVRLAGVKVGTVTGITLDPTTFRAATRLAVRQGIALPEDSAALISSEGLLGGNFVELVPGGSDFMLRPGDEILDTQGAVSLITLLLRFVAGDS
ncbi:MAG: outer membrane lipid asymmetry maintenance protein MlaD [Rhodobacteraceae bacterium]|nr:outer membrane lipid asymmetry maintenance protein MlaD [Paracoccaceae bacterium]